MLVSPLLKLPLDLILLSYECFYGFTAGSKSCAVPSTSVQEATNGSRGRKMSGDTHNPEHRRVIFMTGMGLLVA